MPESNTRKSQTPSGRTIRFYHFPHTVVPALAKAAKLTLSKEKAGKSAAISVVLVSNKKIRELNRTFRRTDRVTDVISFRLSAKPLAGDIYIGRERSQMQAEEYGHPWKEELAYIVIHGVLHLLGYGDYTMKERLKMFSKQDTYFKCLFS